MNTVSQLAFDLTEQGIVPDLVVRRGIRHLLNQRLREIHADDTEAVAADFNALVMRMDNSPIALVPEKANEQHYEVPSDFFRHTLGPHLKYSCGYWPQSVTRLDEAESAALAETCRHAQLVDGQRVLELGCGWGSLSLWMAAQYPASTITAVSNSQSQRAFIERQARERGLTNLSVVTCDMNDFHAQEAHFDRVVCVEMFEHMRNWRALYGRIARWLKPGGRFFKHIFVHRHAPYLFEDNGPGDWMSRHFFSGGMMPSDDLPLTFQHDLRFVRRWRWDGTHYEKTANAWLQRMDERRYELWPVVQKTYGDANAATWWNRWRLFFMACAELFGYDKGQQWWVAHYLFEKPAEGGRAVAP
ncbi:MAG TPA: cyclopropane-fatty-acyl-phospholipid synthase family protein [Gammaproteobacteria bacterium]|nr:cyclopropane-fatty-acyl-phospholipid synthase family protein [Gammaproteobacteria bacterium]